MNFHDANGSAHGPFHIIGAGLAGCECALVLARAGFLVHLHEGKPHYFSPAHLSENLAELVCSNSFRSNDFSRSGIALLKQEMRELGSATMAVASQCQVPAGQALAVDRDLFSQAMTRLIDAEPNITLHRHEVQSLDDACLQGARAVILAVGPLASPAITSSLQDLLPCGSLYFYDAIAPIISADSLDRSIIFAGSRYDNEKSPELNEGDYLNCPMNKEEYQVFYQALLAAEKVQAHDFEKHFEGCMPIEALAERGERTLTFGPFKPVGFDDPRTGRRPWALVQLRAENAQTTAYNLVGCQTKLTYKSQEQVFRLIPGLEKAEFLRFGSMHRNTYINAPLCLNADLSLKGQSHIFLAGQISGVEGYAESAASGLWLGLMLAAKAKGQELVPPPLECALGSLLNHLQQEVKNFQPSNAHFGLMPPLGQAAHKKERKSLYSQRARECFGLWLGACGLIS